MTEEDALLTTIADYPDEDLPRLVYADWLEEHDYPIRAEFIRIQCEIAGKIATLPRAMLDQHVDLFKRDDELRRNHREELLGELAVLQDEHAIQFNRGFISQVELNVDQFLEHGELLSGLRPKAQVRVENVVAKLTSFLCSAFLECVTQIGGDIYGTNRQFAENDDWVDAARRLIKLESLDLAYCTVESQQVLMMMPDATPIPFVSLVDLNVSHSLINDEQLSHFLNSQITRKLRRFDLGGNPITDRGAIELAERWPSQNQLENLDLSRTSIGPIGQQALLQRFGGRIDLF